MKKNVFVALVCAAALSACDNAGDKLATQSAEYAQCSLKEGADCKDKAPDGSTVEKASFMTANDAVRVNGTVKTEAECLSYASEAKPRAAGYAWKSTIDNTVIAAYGDTAPDEDTAKIVCAAKPPHQVSLTMARAPQ